MDNLFEIDCIYIYVYLVYLYYNNKDRNYRKSIWEADYTSYRRKNQ